jgi:hypothetical protein
MEFTSGLYIFRRQLLNKIIAIPVKFSQTENIWQELFPCACRITIKKWHPLRTLLSAFDNLHFYFCYPDFWKADSH